MRRVTFTLLAAIAAAFAPTVAAGATSAIVRDASVAQFPRVTLSVIVPAGVAGAGEAKFAVTENGRDVEILHADRKESDPVDVLLLMDTSGSMNGESIAAAKAAAAGFVGAIDPASSVAIVSFADKPKVALPFTSDHAAMTRAIGSLSASGETSLYDALLLAAAEAGASKSRRPVAVLLSDGGDTVSRGDADAAIRSLRGQRIPVIVVALPSAEADFGVLKAIGQQTGGRFIGVSSTEQLAASYEQLAQEVSAAWTLTYVSNRPSTSDLDVRVAMETAKGSAAGSVVLRNPAFTPGTKGGRVLTDLAPANTLVLVAAMLLAFASVFGLTIAVAMIMYRPRTVLADMRFYDQLHETGGGVESTDGVRSAVYDVVDKIAGRHGFKSAVHEYLQQAGLPLRPTEYITMHLAGVIAVGFIVQVASGKIQLAVLAVLLATALPIIWVRLKVSSRRRRFDDQLPDTLNLLAGSLRAGWGLQHALGLVVEQMPDPIAAEFARASAEVRLGRSVEDSLMAVAERLDSVDFRWTATAISIQREVGGNLAEVLDIVAATMRDRTSLRRHIAGLVAEGRLSAVILVLLPFVLALMLSVVNPAYVSELFTSGPGLAMLAIGSVMLAFGIWWLKRAIAIEV